MKKFILSAIAILMVFGLQAQNGNGRHKMRQNMTPEKMAQFETKRMAKQLKLNETTQAKVQEINLRYAKEQQAFMKEKRKQNHEERKANREEMRKKMMEMKSNKEAEFEKVLSKEDFKTYKEQRKEMHKKMRKNMKKRYKKMEREASKQEKK